MPKYDTFFLGCVSIFYPYAIWMGYGKYIALLLFGLWFIKLAKDFFQKKGQWKISLFFCVFFLMVCVSNHQKTISMLYPCFINLGLCIVFAWSMHGESIITRFAQLEHSLKKLPELDDKEIRYTHILTGVWVAFFMFNFSVCLILVLFDLQTMWALYSGVGGYIIAGIIFLGERMFRKKLKGWLV